MASVAESLTTDQAAELAGLSRAALFTLALRARRDGVELRAPRDTWPDGRTPRWDGDALRRHLTTRPGRGVNLRKISGGAADAGASSQEDFPSDG